MASETLIIIPSLRRNSTECDRLKYEPRDNSLKQLKILAPESCNYAIQFMKQIDKYMQTHTIRLK